MIACPKCGRKFGGRSIGSHALACGVSHLDLFWSKVNKNGRGGCWLWTGRTDKSGYGRLGRKGPTTYAHRISWFCANGSHAPEDMEVAHRCDVRNCVNPEHLFLASHDENMKDCMRKKRHLYGERSHHAKLTEEQVKLIRQLFVRVSEKKSNAIGLAAQFGIKPAAVYKIVNGESWKYV